MKFLDLNTLKIQDIDNYTTYEININYDISKPAKINFETIVDNIQACHLEDTPTLINFRLNKYSLYDFEDAVEIIKAAFIQAINTSTKRAREYRLDVPQTISAVNLSKSALKRIINYESAINIFNVYISSDTFVYKMIDE